MAVQKKSGAATKKTTAVKQAVTKTAAIPLYPYRAEYAEQVYKLCLLGASDEEIIGFFCIPETIMESWQQEHKAFGDAWRKGRQLADAIVADKLYQNAVGYSYTASKIVMVKGEPQVVEYTEYHPPDTRAAMYWLKNRQKDKWRDKQVVEHEGVQELPAPIVHIYNDAPPLAGAEEEVDKDK